MIATNARRAPAAALDELLTVSGAELARRIRAQAVTSRAVVEAHIARIEAVNPTINAVVARRYEAARAEADAADARVAAAQARAQAGEPGALAELPPYLGVPCTIKEQFALTGMPNSSGLVARRQVVSTGDATAVARLRAAGAIPLGVTNVSELCMWTRATTASTGAPTTRTIRRASSAAARAARARSSAPAARRSGSAATSAGRSACRPSSTASSGTSRPAGWCRARGNIRARKGEAARIVATGPMARRAEDLWPLLQLLAGPDGLDEGATAMALGDPASVQLDRLTVVDVEDNGRNPVHPELKAAQARAVDVLARAGARIRRLRFAPLRRSFEIWSATLAAADGQSFSVLLGNGRPTRGARELLKWAVRRSPHTLPAIGLALLERVNDWAPGRAARAVELGRALRAQILDAIGDDGVMLYPSYVSAAPRHYKPLWPPFNFVYTAIVNVMELPATQVPLGLGKGGLPLGVQVIAGPARDHVSIAVAAAARARARRLGPAGVAALSRFATSRSSLAKTPGPAPRTLPRWAQTVLATVTPCSIQAPCVLRNSPSEAACVGPLCSS